MTKLILFMMTAILLMSCKDSKDVNDTIDTWANAKWVALEQMEDSLKLVPGLHGLSKVEENKYLKRSIIPLFRRTFNLNNTIESASINICGLGHYELYINGNKIGDRFLAPGWSFYQKHYLYN